jgi:hypothetical protein
MQVPVMVVITIITTDMIILMAMEVMQDQRRILNQTSVRSRMTPQQAQHADTDLRHIPC